MSSPPADQLVTSSDLVRHFGLWQDRAVRAPLYILHRGRPRFVMTSVETMDALCAPHVEGLAKERAFDDALLATGGVASAIVDPRGYVAEPSASLVALTGLARDTLASIRFVSLADGGGRPALDEAIDATLAGAPARVVKVRLLLDHADPLPVRIGLAPLRTSGGIDGVAAVIVVRAP